MKAYCDGSGDKASEFLVLTGVAASDYVWAGFEKQWLKILSTRTPIAPYFHTSELLALAGDFTVEKGWDQSKASKLLWDCLFYLQHLDKSDFRVFTCTVDMETYRALKLDGRHLPGAYSICSRFSSEMILKWYLQGFHKNYAQARLHYFFDRGERHKGAFERRRRAGEKAGKKPGLHLLTYWDLVETVADASVITLKPAIRYHFKTGQRDWPET
jgi:hypothetical protein